MDARFYEKGFTDRKLPEDTEAEPTLPYKISRVNNVNLGNLMSEYGAWREYTEHLLARATTEAAVLKEKYDFAWDVAYQRCSSGTETSKKRALGADQALAAKRINLLEAEMYRDMLLSRVDSYNNALTVISREITRRGFTFEQK